MLPKVHYKYFRVNPDLPKLGGRKGQPLTRYSRGNGFLVLDRHGRPAFMKRPPDTNGGAVVAFVKPKPGAATLYGMSVCSPDEAFSYRVGRDGKHDGEIEQRGAKDALLEKLLEEGYDEASVEW